MSLTVPLRLDKGSKPIKDSKEVVVGSHVKGNSMIIDNDDEISSLLQPNDEIPQEDATNNNVEYVFKFIDDIVCKPRNESFEVFIKAHKNCIVESKILTWRLRM